MIKPFVFLLFLVTSASVYAQQPAPTVSPTPSKRYIPDDSLALPVRVTTRLCSTGSGDSASGFFLETGSESYFITARHVLFDESRTDLPLKCAQAELLSYSRDPKEKGRNVLLLDLDALQRAGKVKSHPTHDVAVVGFATAERPQVELFRGVELKEHSATGIVAAPISHLKKLDEVLTANEIYVFGYPSSIGIPHIPQVDYFRPLLKQGIVAGINAEKQFIIIDCMMFHGNSGSLVLQIEGENWFQRKLFVIGIVSQFVPNVFNKQINNSGYSVVIPMDMVLELVK